MSRYKNEKFDFSEMSERITFQVMAADGTYSDSIRVWAHFLKDGFTRTEDENVWKIMVREQKALDTVLTKSTRIKWKNLLLSVYAWQDPSYEQRGFIEILAKQIPNIDGGDGGGGEGPGTDTDLFPDVVSVYKLNKVEKVEYGITNYAYEYDFSTPSSTDIRCKFSTDRNRYLDDSKTDVEHDSLYVYFSLLAPVNIEDYIESPVHGRFKIDMLVKNADNMLEALVQRREVQ